MKFKSPPLVTLGLLIGLIVLCAAPKQAYALLHDGPLVLNNNKTYTVAAELDVWVYGAEDQAQLPSYFVDNNLIPVGGQHLFTYEVNNTDGMPILSTSLKLDPDSTQYVMETGSLSGLTQGFVSESGEDNFIYFSGFLNPGSSDTYYVLANTEPILGIVGLDMPYGGAAAETWLPDAPCEGPDCVNENTNGIPEPGTLLLLGSALIGLAGMRRVYSRK
jgi:hypothetical protein